MVRNERAATTSVTWQDDLSIEWGGPDGVCRVRAVLDYYGADARIIRNRGGMTDILASGLGAKMSYAARYEMKEGDVVILQWRALTPSESAYSEVAELTVEEVKDQFE